MTSEAKIQEAADRIWQAWQTNTPGTPIRDLLDSYNFV